MEFEWKRVEIPLHHAVEKHYLGWSYEKDNYEERTFTSGPAKGGAFLEKASAYELNLFFENIPQFLRTCYVRWGGISYGNNNVTLNTVSYRKEDDKYIETGRASTTTSFAVACRLYTLNERIPASDSGSFTGFTEKNLQIVLNNNSIREFITLRYNQIGDKYFEYTRNEFDDVSKISLVLEYSEAPVDIIPIYPIDVYLKNTRPLEISWESRIAVYKEPSVESNNYKKADDVLYISQTKIELWNDDGVKTEHIISGTANVYEISAAEISSFSIGNLYYKISVSTNAGVNEYIESKCILTGETDAPNILGHINNSFPVISWSCDNQSAWQMIVKQGNNVLFDSGIKPGNEHEYKIPILMDDGNYSVEMRVINIFGFYTAWSSYLMVLNTVKPSSPSGIIVSANNKFGITVKCNIPDDAGTLFVMRRKDSLSKVEIVGEYKENFTDYKIELNESYEYTVRNYVEGCADGDWIDAVVNAEGIVIRKANDFVHLFMAETEFDVIKADERDDVLSKCVGRTFPVLEIGEWITSTRRAGGCVSNDDYKLLIEMSLNGSVMLQSNKEVIPCYMRVSDRGKHVSGGRLVELVFTRIDGE